MVPLPVPNLVTCSSFSSGTGRAPPGWRRCGSNRSARPPACRRWSGARAACRRRRRCCWWSRGRRHHVAAVETLLSRGGESWPALILPSACTSATPWMAPVLTVLLNDAGVDPALVDVPDVEAGRLGAPRDGGFIWAVSLSTAARFSRMKYSPVRLGLQNPNGVRGGYRVQRDGAGGPSGCPP